MDHFKQIRKHYCELWGNCTSHRFGRGPVHELPAGFEILKFPPRSSRNMWTYAACGMSDCSGGNAIEIHIFSSAEHDFLIELLTIIAHYHVTGGNLGSGHTIYFGCPWYKDSNAEFGLISKPYLDGPVLEEFRIGLEKIIFLWLIPITASERNYKVQYGLEALEQKFEETGFCYLDPYRESVV